MMTCPMDGKFLRSLCVISIFTELMAEPVPVMDSLTIGCGPSTPVILTRAIFPPATFRNGRTSSRTCPRKEKVGEFVRLRAKRTSAVGRTISV